MQITSNNGMTLIELIITISIVAIIATYSAASLSDLMERQRLKSAGETIFADLRFAQSEAIKRNKKVYVDFKTSSNPSGIPSGIRWCYGTNVGSECDCNIPNQCQINNIDKVVRSEKFKDISIQRARFAGNKSYTAFDPVNGFALANGAKNGTIWLKSKNGTQLAIIVNRLGRLRFCSPTLSEYSNQCPSPP